MQPPRVVLVDHEAIPRLLFGGRVSARLGRELEIRQGAGSRILARPLGDGMVEIGGRVELDEVRAFSV